MIQIRAAQNHEYDQVRSFYHSMIDAMENAPHGPEWKKDIYPSNEYLKTSIANGELYIGVIADRIAAAMIINHSCNDGYAKAPWPTQANDTEVTVIHALGVHPNFARKGFGKEMVSWAIAAASELRQKAVRLDVLQGNLPAERLYASVGFQYIATVQIYYEDTGWTACELFEYPLAAPRADGQNACKN